MVKKQLFIKSRDSIRRPNTKFSSFGWVVLITLILILSMTMLAGILAPSNDPCAPCHSSYSQRCNLLPLDSLSSLPTTFNSASATDVKIAVEIVGTDTSSHYLIDTLRVTLSSSNSNVNIPNAQQSDNNHYPGDKVVFQWSVTGTSAGSDTLNFGLYAHNPHKDCTFSDSHFYSINVQDTPSEPQNLQATWGDTFVELSWQLPSSDGGVSLTGYNIHRGTSAGVKPKSLIDSVSASTYSYNDTSVTNGQTYYYYIVAVNSIGNSDPSSEVSAAPELGGKKPGPPQNLEAKAGNGYVDLDWEAPANDGGMPITGYKIYSDTSSGTKSELTSLSTSTLSYQDTSVVNGVTYYYHVTAINIKGESDPSSEVYAMPDGTPPNVAITTPRNNSYHTQNSVKVEWKGSDIGIGIDHYEIKLNNGKWIDLGEATSYTFSSIAEGKYTAYLKCEDTLGNVNLTSVSFTVDWHAPVIKINSPLNNSYNIEGSVILEWQGSDEISGIDFYETRYNTKSWTNVGVGDSHTFESLEDGNYNFELKAVDFAQNTASVSINIIIDTTQPDILKFSPSKNKAPIDSKISITFSEPMDESSIELDVTNVKGSVAWDDGLLIFTPKSDLDYETTYDVYIDGNDLAGNALPSQHYSFTTKALEKITGRVLDIDEKPVEGANIILATGERTTTDADGYFTLAAHPGTFSVSIEKEGYENQRLDMSLNNGETKDIGIVYFKSTQTKDESNADPQNLLWLSIIIIMVVIIIVIIAVVLIKSRSSK